MKSGAKLGGGRKAKKSAITMGLYHAEVRTKFLKHFDGKGKKCVRNGSQRGHRGRARLERGVNGSTPTGSTRSPTQFRER